MWIAGSDVVVIDPPRKGLDVSLIDALKNISSIERKVLSSSERWFVLWIYQIWSIWKYFPKSVSDLVKVYYSSNSVQEEKRPWVLRAKEASVQVGSKPPAENIPQSVPQTLIYISCGWQSFKEVILYLIVFGCTFDFCRT